jgi:hypothetical protein
MRRFALYLLAALCLGAVLAAPATAKKESTNGTVVVTPISQEGNPPASGSARLAGEIKGDLGPGAYVGTTNFGPPGQFNGTFRAFFKKGTIKGQLSGTGAPNPNGGIDISGSGTYTGGSGRYKGAKGSFTFQGHQPADSQVTTFQVEGKIKY